MWKKLLLLLTLCFLVLPVFAEESESEVETETEIDYKALIDQVDPEAEYVFTGEEVINTLLVLEEADELWDDYDELWENRNALIDVAKEYQRRYEQLKIENDLLFGGITISVSIVVAGAAIWLCTALDNTENW